jgi:hypothetical protein
MDLTTILTEHREPIIEEWVRRLQTEVSPRYSERPLKELFLTVSRVYDANFAVILHDDYSLSGHCSVRIGTWARPVRFRASPGRPYATS